MKTKRTLATFVAAFVCALLMTSCDMFEDYHSPEHQANLYANLTEGRDKKIIPNDSLEYMTGIDAKMRFVGKDSVENSFVEVSHYRKAGDIANDERTSIWYQLPHFGSPVLYFENIDDTLFTTAKGQDSVVVNIDTLMGNWKASVLATKQDWDNSNSNNDFFKHYTTTGSAAMRYAVAKTDTCAGYEVDFEKPTYELTESTSYQDVTGVVYNNKTWEAVMRTSEVVATFEIPEGFRISGEAFQKALSVKNIAYFLKHVVNTDAEGLNYEAKFNAQGAELTTEIQKVSGSLVTRDNDEVSKSEDFALNLNLEASMSQPDDVQVTSEEALSNINITHRLGNFTESAPVAEGVFSKTNFSAMDTIVLADTTITVVYAFEKYSWMNDFTYARIADREVRIESVKNDARSNNKVLVNTVTVYVDINVEFEGIDRPAEKYTVQVSYDRVYTRPDNYKTVYSWVGYFLKLIQENDSKVIAEQADTLHKTVTNNGELESSTFKAYNLDMYISLEGGDTVIVDAPFTATAQYVEDHPNKAAYKGADEDGINVLGTSDSQTLKMKGGNTLNLKWYQESLTKDGKTVAQNATYNGTTASNVTVSDPVMVDSSIVNGEIVKVYRLIANVPTNVNDPRNTASLAPTRGSGSTGFSVSAPFYQKVVEADELIAGSERIVRTEEPDGKNIKVTEQLFETWKIAGEILKDEQSAVMFSELEGTDGDAIWVSNTNFVTTGAGLTCTGSGEYTNTSDNNYESYTNAFRYNVTDEKVFSLNGTNGVINDTVRGTMVITEKSYSISERTALAGGIDQYVATSTIEGVYTVGSASVKHTASATKPLQEARAIPDCSTNETGRILAAYFTVVPGHWNKYTNKFEDAAGAQYAIKNMLVVYENGATAVPFAYETSSDVLVPSADDILNGNFVAGDFTDDFNSGYYSQIDKKWIPAIASDTDGGINYATATNPLARPVRNESLNMWNWRNGNHSTQLTGYTCVVDENSGVLTVSYNGSIIFEGK